MGKRGPAPKPAVLKTERGKRGANLADNIKPDVAIPECPDFVCQSGQREWARITPYLARLGLISHLDMAALALYCQTFGRYSDLEAGFESQIQRIQIAQRCTYLDAVQLAFIDVTPNGYKQVSALASTIRGQLIEWGCVLGGRSDATAFFHAVFEVKNGKKTRKCTGRTAGFAGFRARMGGGANFGGVQCRRRRLLAE